MIKSIFLVSLFLIGCAGNPPAWWDPSNRYAPVSQQTQPAETKQPATAVPQTQEEETFSFETDSEYEEMAISPDEADEKSAAIQTPAAAAAKSETLSPSLLNEE